MHPSCDVRNKILILVVLRKRGAQFPTNLGNGAPANAPFSKFLNISYQARAFQMLTFFASILATCPLDLRLLLWKQKNLLRKLLWAKDQRRVSLTILTCLQMPLYNLKSQKRRTFSKDCAQNHWSIVPSNHDFRMSEWTISEIKLVAKQPLNLRCQLWLSELVTEVPFHCRRLPEPMSHCG